MARKEAANGLSVARTEVEPVTIQGKRFREVKPIMAFLPGPDGDLVPIESWGAEITDLKAAIENVKAWDGKGPVYLMRHLATVLNQDEVVRKTIVT